MNITLKKQVAVITGGDSGIGHGIALSFAKAGAAVVINYHSDQKKASATVAAIKKRGGKAIAVKGDVANESDVENLFKTTCETFGGIDILVANSGLQKDAAIAEMTIDDWRTVINTNLTGQFLCARTAIRLFRKQKNRAFSRAKGNIICMSSVHEVIPWAGHVNYAASKGGVALLMKTLAQEVAPDKIRVNAIAPGAIRTPINEKATQGAAAKKLLKLIPYGRIGDPEDVANVALFLASDFADYVTGATIFVDGGMTLYPGFEDNG